MASARASTRAMLAVLSVAGAVGVASSAAIRFVIVLFILKRCGY